MLSAEEKAFEQTCLEAHNRYRALHGVPPLKINPELTKFAKTWARACLDSDNIVRRESAYGSNIYAAQNIEVDGEKVAKFWYDEVKKYDFNNPRFSTETGGFTQLVWKDTSELGVGIAKKGDSTYVVAIYQTPGNILGTFNENVPRTLTEQAKMTAKPKPKPVAVPAISSADDEKNFERACLMAHNKYRAYHGTPPLTINPELTKHAQMWSEVCLKNNVMKHSDGHNYGENIYFAMNLKVDAVIPVEAWYDEIKHYNYNDPKFSPDTGHFTQLIWKGAREVGIGIARGGGLTYVVANYEPTGNVLGQFKENVPLPIPIPLKPVSRVVAPAKAVPPKLKIPSKAIPVKHPPLKNVPAGPNTKGLPLKITPAKPQSPPKPRQAQPPVKHIPPTSQSTTKQVTALPHKPMPASPPGQVPQKTVSQKHAAPQKASPSRPILQKEIPPQSTLIQRQPTLVQAFQAQPKPVLVKGPATRRQPDTTQALQTHQQTVQGQTPATHQKPSPILETPSKPEQQPISQKTEQQPPKRAPANLLRLMPKNIVYTVQDKHNPNEKRIVHFRPFVVNRVREIASIWNSLGVKSTHAKSIPVSLPAKSQSKPAQSVRTQPNVNVNKPASDKSVPPASDPQLPAKRQSLTNSIQGKKSHPLSEPSSKPRIKMCLLAPKDPTKPYPIDASRASREHLEAKMNEKERENQTKPIQSRASQAISGSAKSSQAVPPQNASQVIARPPIPSQVDSTQAATTQLRPSTGPVPPEPSLKYIVSTEEIPEKVKAVQVKPSEIRSAEARANQIKAREGRFPPPLLPNQNRPDKGKLAGTTKRLSNIKPPPRIVVRSTRIQPLPHGLQRDVPEILDQKLTAKQGQKPTQGPAQKSRISISQGDKTVTTRPIQGRIAVRAIKIQPPASHVVQVTRTYKPMAQSGKGNRHVGSGQEKFNKIVVRAVKIQPPPTHVIEITKSEKHSGQKAGQKLVQKSVPKLGEKSGKIPEQMRRGSQGESVQLKPSQGRTRRIVVRNINVKQPPVHVVQFHKTQKPKQNQGRSNQIVVRNSNVQTTTIHGDQIGKIQKPIRKSIQKFVHIRWSAQGTSSHVTANQGINHQPSLKAPPNQIGPNQERLSKIDAGDDRLRNGKKLPPPQFKVHVTQTALQKSRSDGRSSTQSNAYEGEENIVPFNLRARIIIRSKPPTTKS